MPHRVLIGLAVTLLACLAAACGKKGPPLPPLRIVPAEIEDLKVRQVGERVVLTFPTPSVRTDGTPLGDDARIEILMNAQEPPPSMPAPIEENALIVWEIGASDWGLYAQGGRLRVSLRIASIAQGMQRPVSDLRNHRLNFTVRAVERKKARSRASSPGSVVICAPPVPPSEGRVDLTESGITLTWSEAEAGVQFNVYRMEEGSIRSMKPLNERPLTEREYVDVGVPPDRSYRYTVRSTKGMSSCESLDGAAVTTLWHDTFPPVPPAGLDAVTEQGTIRLFWRPSMDADLAGYHVYRSEGAEGVRQRLTGEAIVTTTYTDIAVEPGIQYHYAVTAVDSADPPNESGFSEPATEEIPSP